MRDASRVIRATLALMLSFAILPATAPGAESLLIRSISFVDATHGYVSGQKLSGGGFVSYTADSGASWTHSAFPGAVWGLFASDASTASFVEFFGDSVFTTTNSAGLWSESGMMLPGAGSLDMKDVARLGGGVLVAVGKHVDAPGGALATIWRSDDHGATWSNVFDGPLQPPPPPPNDDEDPPSTIADLVSVGFASDGLTGWALGTEWSPHYGTPSQLFKQVLLYKTVDGGSTWTTQTVPGGVTRQPATSLSVVDASTAWFGCADGAVYRTINGTNWGASFAPFGATNYGRFSVSAVSGANAVVVGENGKVSRTSNGGAYWPPFIQPTTQHLYSVDMVDASVGYAGGKDVLLKTSDGGASWAPVSISLNLSPVSVGDSYQTDEDKPLVVGAIGGVLANDTDSNLDPLTAVKFANPSHGAVTLNTNGSFTYTPAKDWHGTDSFKYRAYDGTSYSADATVMIDVASVLEPTAFTGSSGTKTTSYYAATTLYADLKAGTSPLANKAVYLEYSTNGSTGWTKATATITQPMAGRYQVSVKRPTTRYYRFRYDGEPGLDLAGCTGPVTKYYPKASLTTPVTPSYVYRYKTLTAYDYVKPRHTAGTKPVRFYFERWNGSRYVYVKYVYAYASNYSSYTKATAKTSLTSRGKWRVRVRHVADTSNADTYSAYRYFTVR